MNMAISGASARANINHAKPANFGQLNAAIERGDLAAAQTAFTAINESSTPSAMAAKAKGMLEPIGSAIASGDVEAAKKSIADFRTGRIIQPVVALAPEPSSGTEPIAAITVQAGETTTSTKQMLALLNGTGSSANALA